MSDSAPTNAEKMRGLPWGVAFAVANSVYVQYTFFGSIFILFLNELGLGKTAMGSLLSLLPFFGVVALFVAPTVDRLGYKRTFVGFFGARTAASVFLLLTPWVAAQFGSRVVLLFIVAIVALFSVFRAIGLTAFYPWLQEHVPNSVRGKYSAVKNSLSSLAAFLSVVAAGYVIGDAPDMGNFMTLFGVAMLFGVVSVWASSFIAGGAPKTAPAERTSYQALAQAARDRNFLRYLVGEGLITLGTVPLVSFLPLFMIEKVGLTSGHTVWLQNGTLLGGLLSSYLWGWAADRYGSKPVMLSGVSLMAVLPLLWLLMPQRHAWSLYAALGIALLQGLVNTSWSIGSSRLLFVSVVPFRKKTEYMALYYAWIGVVGGVGQLAGGWLLDRFAGLEGQLGFIAIDSYTVLFAIGLLFPLASVLLFRRVRPDSAVTMGEFAGMFFRGNPLLAAESLVGYHRARDERAAVSMTERLGLANSPFTVEELLEALADPRFFVRFEAIVSIARRGPDERLMEALIATLGGDDPALSVIAAWALGRIGDERAIEPLRRGLNAPYRSVQAHCARSLSNLDDREMLPLLLERLADERDLGLRMAYASAVGRLEAREALPDLLSLLEQSQDEASRMELALALARLMGDEHPFIQLVRQGRGELGTATSQALTGLRKRLVRLAPAADGLAERVDRCADALARDSLDEGVHLLRGVVGALPLEALGPTCAAVLQACAAGLAQHGAGRREYLLLALRALECGADRSA